MNWDLLGHEWAVNLLQQYIRQGQLRQAYLLTGPQGVGRRTLALRLVQALDCPKPLSPGEPCRTCRTCLQIERMEHTDLAVVQAEQRGGTLKVDQVRELQHSLALAPYQGRYRVALLLHFEEAHPSASNALLKTLEEPPPQVILILTADAAENLLPTVVSRCEVLRLRPLPFEAVSQGLRTRFGLPPDQATLLAHISGGRPGYALRLHQEPDRMVERQTWLDDHAWLLTASRVDRFAFAEKVSKDKESLRAILAIWLSFWRDILLRATGSSSPLANLDRVSEIENLAAHYGLEAAHRNLTSLERTLDLLERNVNPRLAVEVLLLDLPR